MRRRPSLCGLYAALNARCFAGQLPTAIASAKWFGGPASERGVVVRRVRTRFDLTEEIPCLRGDALGRFIGPGEFWPARILLTAWLSPDGEAEVLGHEMIHAQLYFAGFPKEGHGARFLAELDRLASLGEAWAVRQGALWRRAS